MVRGGGDEDSGGGLLRMSLMFKSLENVSHLLHRLMNLVERCLCFRRLDLWRRCQLSRQLFDVLAPLHFFLFPLLIMSGVVVLNLGPPCLFLLPFAIALN